MVGGSTMEVELAELAPWPKPAPPISQEERLARLAQAQGLMTTGAMVVGAGASLRYFTGVAWNPTERLVAMVLPKAGAPVMVCPRFEQGSLDAALGIEASLRLWEEHESPYALVADHRGPGRRVAGHRPGAGLRHYDGLRAAAPQAAMPSAAPGSTAAG